MPGLEETGRSSGGRAMGEARRGGNSLGNWVCLGATPNTTELQEGAWITCGISKHHPHIARIQKQITVEEFKRNSEKHPKAEYFGEQASSPEPSHLARGTPG